MKRCPNCNDMALYEDAEMTCPICHSALVRCPANSGHTAGSSPSGERGATYSRRPVIAADTSHTDRRVRAHVPHTEAPPPTELPRMEDYQQPPRRPQREGRAVVNPVVRQRSQGEEGDYNERGENRHTGQTRTSNTDRTARPPQFDEPIGGRRHIFRGRVAEVSSHSRYYNRFHKFVNMGVRNEPYQFGNASYETVIRIEEFTDGHLVSQYRDLVMYGDVEGSVHEGDDVEVLAIESGGRYVIRRLHNNQTESDVVPGPQISALAGVLLAVAVVAIFAGLLYGIYTFFTKGGFDALVMALVNLALAIFVRVLPILFVFYILKLFLGIGRRR